MDGDRDLCRVCYARCIVHGIGEHIAKRVCRCSQSLNVCVDIVDRIGIRSISSDTDRTVGARHTGCYVARSTGLCTCEDSDDRFRFSVTGGILVGIVGENIAGWIGTGRRVRNPACFDSRRRIDNSDRCIVCTLDRNSDLRRTSKARCVTHCIRKHIGQRLAC